MKGNRPDLDGCRVVVSGQPEAWLVFGGELHYISTIEVYQSLFKSAEDLVEIDSIKDLIVGSPLNEGTCLVRSMEDGAMFLVTGSPPAQIAKHYIVSQRTFDDFGFNSQRVNNVPKIMILGLRTGIELQSDEERNDITRNG